MTVDQAIVSAEYGLRRMKENSPEFDFYFKGTLVNLKGALDYLLEEYNSKYSVGFTDHEELNMGAFKARVQGGRNPTADTFIDYYKQKKEDLLADSRCKKLLERHGSRDIAVHRRTPGRTIAVSLVETISLSVAVEVRDRDGNIVSRGGTPPQPVQPHPPEIAYFLSDWPSEDLPTLCEYVLGKVKDFVTDLHTSFP